MSRISIATVGAATWLLSLSWALPIGPAVAQPPTWPIVNGHQLQPTRQQLDTRNADRSREWNRRVQPEVDRLYEELMRETPTWKR
jgi:hypothetical protein